MRWFAVSLLAGLLLVAHLTGQLGWYPERMPGWWAWPLLGIGLVRLGFLSRHWRDDHAALQLWWALRQFERQVERWERQG